MSLCYRRGMLRLALVLLIPAIPVVAQSTGQLFRLENPGGLKPLNVKLDAVEFSGRKAVHVTPSAEDNGMAIIAFRFQDGTIEVDAAGQPAKGAMEGARGFIGIAFRVGADEKHYECFYLRPTNGRAEDQVRRNHSVQYEAEPDYPWNRLRKENPGEYESYADLQPGVWTSMKIVVAGTKARLYLNEAEQPCLIVNDLKHGATSGALALWVGPGTDGYFSNLRVSAAH